MGTPRWQMREFEQQQLVEALFDAVTDRADEDGELGWDDCLYLLSETLFCFLPLSPKRVDGIRACVMEKGGPVTIRELDPFIESKLWRDSSPQARATYRRAAMTIATISCFSKTAGEAEYLLWRFHARLLESLQSRFTRAYAHEAVHGQERLYGGPGMDDVPRDEHDRRSAIAANSESLLVKVV